MNEKNDASPKRRFRYVPLGALPCALIIALGAFAIAGYFFFNLDMNAAYATYEDALADGAIARGWIPDFVPVSAMNIHATQNLDTNQQWAAFTFAAEDQASLVAQLAPIDAVQVSFCRPKTRGGHAWWPEALAGPEAAGRDDYAFYSFSTRHGNYIIAVAKEEPRAYFQLMPRFHIP